MSAPPVGVGTKVTLSAEDGTKDYLLLRIVPVEILKKVWIFPTDFSSAEVGIITSSGDYVVQSESMKSQNFLEYIRGYNFQDDYNKVTKLKQRLQSTKSGILEYKNFRGTDCIWYYSSFGTDSVLDIVGVLNVSELKTTMDGWYIVLIICGTLIILTWIDGIYLLSINRRLREEAKRAEQASRAKTQFLSAMSHDIRTPLNAVLGMMTIAQRRAQDAEFVTNCMEKGINSGRQLLTLINDVLDISKIESGKVTLNPERIFLKDIIQNLTEMIEPYASEKRLKLQCEFEPLPYEWIRADRMRLNQIYMNLLSNAVKYTDPEGTIHIRLREEAIPGRTDRTCLIFSVEDTGIGMTEEFQEQMYSMFSREVSTQVNRTQGTGLGLSIVKQMVDLMGGTILCKSAPGCGTLFTVKLEVPVEIGEEKARTKQNSAQDVENMHLLVAEDNDLNWEVFYELVADLKIVCDRVKNGKECIDVLTAAPVGTYDGILMDVQMPVMNGYEATKQIRRLEDRRLREIPIIAMTADAFAEDVQACMACGMNGHIAKPISLRNLVEYLSEIKNTN